MVRLGHFARKMRGLQIAVAWMAASSEATFAQNVNDQLILPPPLRPAIEALEPIPDGEGTYTFAVPSTLPVSEALVNTNYLGRAALFGDSTRLADFAKGTFLPSAIPVAGQPFHGSDARAGLQANGSAVRVNAYAPSSLGLAAAAHAQLMVDNASIASTDSSDAVEFSVRQVFVQLNRLQVGVMDTAFSDPSAMPETLDLAGPNSRITAYDAGVGSGQGRISYDLLTDAPDGFEIVTSVEQAIPELTPVIATDKTLARYPDFICTAQYVDGDLIAGRFEELWHLQFASVFRDLALESPSGATESAFGWGTALSGAYRLRLTPNVSSLDRLMFSIGYGEGISHYFVDLNAASDTGDGVVNAAGTLEALPVLAWYTAYSHNWTDWLRSTATFSQVNLDSTTPFSATASPYRRGNYVGANLVYHEQFSSSDKPGATQQNFFTGIEYLYGTKETLNGAEGEAHRLMFIVAISK